jgi:hypothetical protein
MSERPKFGSNSRNDSWEEDPGPDPLPEECLQEPEALIPSERRKDHHKKQKKYPDSYSKDMEFKSKYVESFNVFI